MISILRGNCLETMKALAAGSVHTCVTSPPYWGLRDYGHPGQLGLEPTPEEYVANMVEVFREVKRVLRNDGTLWLNLGDSYNTSAAGNKTPSGFSQTRPSRVNGNGDQETVKTGRALVKGLKPKDLVGIPWMMAFALRADGWYLRSDIIWHKPNPMPESCTDRPTKAHEYIFLLTKRPTYYYDVDAIREPHIWADDPRNDGKRHTYADDAKHNQVDPDRQRTKTDAVSFHPAGRNKRTVWTVSTKPFAGAHFATFPTDLIEPCIKAGTGERGCCATCGAPWERVVVDTGERREVEHYDGEARKDYEQAGVQNPSDVKRRVLESMSKVTRSEWQPGCACGCFDDPIPCTVLDPFGGAGTTGLVADRLGRDAILCELNPEYIDLAKRRLEGDAPLLADVETA